MNLRLWPPAWVSPAFAWSCLALQLKTMHEEFTVNYAITDDATEEELLEIAAEQREITRWPVAQAQAEGTA